ncbi:AMP-binding protein [Kibdelosporangium aridum]|uniref:AMP-binding enzyme n=1 Tax=Kibdelosporangium aridum TaxID=2030 RepID=A0A1W2FZD3_KIBAR|nr:AMP-binding protein [Kibdelosporangium aridum]SMD27261.1 AMP-binding enzyme [Kibdelosporangium aridum]
MRLLVRVGPAVDNPGPVVPELEDLLAATEPRPGEPRAGSDQLMMYTGGTTGRPKGVIWRQTDLLHALVVPIFRPLGVSALPSTLD